MSRLVAFERLRLSDLPKIEDPTNAAWGLKSGIDPIENLDHILNGGETMGLVSRFSTYESEASRLKTIKHDLEWGYLVLLKEWVSNPLIKHDPTKEGRDQWVIVATDPMKQSLASKFIDRALGNEPVGGRPQPPKPVEKLVKVVTDKKTEPVHFVELNLHYDDHDTTPVRGAPYKLTYSDGSTATGQLNSNGYAKHEGIPPGTVSVEYLKDEGAQSDVDALINDLKQELDSITSRAAHDADLLATEFDKTSTGMKAVIYTGAALQGGWDTFKGLGSLVKATVKGLAGASMSYMDLWEDILSGDIDSIEKKLMEAAQDGQTSYSKAKETAEAINLIYREEALWEALISFPEDYWDALHPVEATRKAAPFVIDIMITIFSAGVGAAFVVASKGSKAAHLAQKAGAILNKLVLALKKRKHAVKKTGKSNSTIEATVPKEKKPKAKPKAIPRLNKTKVRCFKKNKKKHDAAEYDRQLKGQQDALNEIQVGNYISARESFGCVNICTGKKIPGCTKARRNSTKAKDIRDKHEEKLQKEYYRKNLKKKIPAKEAILLAAEKSKSEMRKLNALHNPDMIAGGADEFASGDIAMGSAGINKSIGSQWQDRVGKMDKAACKAKKDKKEDHKMNVELNRCGKK